MKQLLAALVVVAGLFFTVSPSEAKAQSIVIGPGGVGFGVGSAYRYGGYGYGNYGYGGYGYQPYYGYRSGYYSRPYYGYRSGYRSYPYYGYRGGYYGRRW